MAECKITDGDGIDDHARRARERRDNRIMLLIAMASALVIAVVLYFAGAFTRSTG